MLTYMCQKYICGQPTTCRETDNITDLFNTDGYIWRPDTICVPCMSIHGHPGTAYGAYVVTRGPHMALMWSPAYRAWGLCGRPGAVYGAYVVNRVPHVGRTWCTYGTYMADIWRIRGVWMPQMRCTWRMRGIFMAPPFGWGLLSPGRQLISQYKQHELQAVLNTQFSTIQKTIGK